MKESIAEWLEPMIRAASGDVLAGLMTQATMPEGEAGDQTAAMAALLDVPELGPRGFGAIDWVQFGQLLREHLGWSDYPEFP